MDLAAELGDAALAQFVEPGDVIGVIAGGGAVLDVRQDGVVALVGESAAEIVEFLLAVARSGLEVGEGGARLDLHGDGVPVLEAMAVDGAREQQFLPRAPNLRVRLVLVVLLLLQVWVLGRVVVLVVFHMI